MHNIIIISIPCHSVYTKETQFTMVNNKHCKTHSKTQCQSNKQESHYAQFKKLRNIVVSVMRKEKQQYFSNRTYREKQKKHSPVSHTHDCVEASFPNGLGIGMRTLFANVFGNNRIMKGTKVQTPGARAIINTHAHR